MDSPLFSIIVPCYNHAASLGEAIRSALAQSWRDFELIVVNDGSTDATPDVVRQFTDPRVRYLEQQNRGTSAARNTGMRASAGRYIAFLDADDIWHPEKLRVHARKADARPRPGVLYNARIDVSQESGAIRGLWRPPATVGLAELVLGFPFSPSDVVVEREWAFKVGLFDERYVFYGDDLDFFFRLALAGCPFVGVNRALSFRRHRSKRPIVDLPRCVRDGLRPLDEVFANPACPPEVMALRGRAFANHLVIWAARAFAQQDTEVGQELVRRAAALDRTILIGDPCPLVNELLQFSLADEGADHEALLSSFVAQLPPEFEELPRQAPPAIAYGYLLKGTHAVMWGRGGAGLTDLRRAVSLGARADRAYFQIVVSRLLDCEVEWGIEAPRRILRGLASSLVEVGLAPHPGRLEAEYLMGRAFRDHGAGWPGDVPRSVIRAFVKDPRWLANRGAHSILVRASAAAVAGHGRRRGADGVERP